MITLLATLFGTSGLAGEPGTEAARLAATLTGSWSNAAQHQATPDALRREPAAGHPYDWLDLQHARFLPVAAPSINGEAVYLEWRSGGPEGPVSRQRLWVFHAGPDGRLTGMDFYALREPQRWEGHDTPDVFTALAPEDLVGYPPSCRLTARDGFGETTVLFVSDTDCRITAQSGRDMTIEARVSISAARIEYSESGRLEGGAYAFKVPGGSRYVFERW